MRCCQIIADGRNRRFRIGIRVCVVGGQFHDGLWIHLPETGTTHKRKRKKKSDKQLGKTHALYAYIVHDSCMILA